MLSTQSIADASLTIRDEENKFVEMPFRDAYPEMIRAALPYRTFRWYRGQRHYSGSYWSSTNSAHVIYESRLELARLLAADFDTSVTRIVAQPFLLRVLIKGRTRRHIPDYLLLTPDAPVVVDVKPAKRLSDPVVLETFAWTRDVVESIGWRFEIASEPPEALLENVRFLSGSPGRIDLAVVPRGPACTGVWRHGVQGHQRRGVSTEASRPCSDVAHAVDTGVHRGSQWRTGLQVCAPTQCGSSRCC